MKLAGTSDPGKYVVVWKRQEDDWKLAVDIWNTNSPLPAA
jgi:ketosteroid isomerase-like protein